MTVTALQHCKSLQKLEITSEVDNLYWFKERLSRVGASALKEVTIALIAYFSKDSLSYCTLDEVFCKPPYLNLERLHVMCRPEDPQPPDDDDSDSSQVEEYSVLQGDAEQWTAAIEEYFPNCLTRGILTIDVEMCM